MNFLANFVYNKIMRKINVNFCPVCGGRGGGENDEEYDGRLRCDISISNNY